MGQSSSAICLKPTDSQLIYLLIVCGVLDYEAQSEYQITLIVRNEEAAERDETDQIILQHPLTLEIIDINDNAPKWNQTKFKLKWHLSEVEGNVVLEDGNYHRLVAEDPDSGENGRIRYSINGTSLFKIDAETGLLSLNENEVNFIFIFTLEIWKNFYLFLC